MFGTISRLGFMSRKGNKQCVCESLDIITPRVFRATTNKVHLDAWTKCLWSVCVRSGIKLWWRKPGDTTTLLAYINGTNLMQKRSPQISCKNLTAKTSAQLVCFILFYYIFQIPSIHYSTQATATSCASTRKPVTYHETRPTPTQSPTGTAPRGFDDASPSPGSSRLGPRKSVKFEHPSQMLEPWSIDMKSPTLPAKGDTAPLIDEVVTDLAVKRI